MKIIITGGGTGGHLIPAIELGKLLMNQGNDVVLYASKKGNDKTIINGEDLNYPVNYFDLRGFQRSFTPKNIILNVINLFKLAYLLVKSFFIIKKNNPDLIIGTGGYVEFPLIYMGTLLKKKTIIYEQNSFPGIANRYLGKKVDKVGYFFEATRRYFPEEKLFFGSNPAVLRVNEELIKQEEKIDVLFLGGSLGSRIINELAQNLARTNANLKIKLISGTNQAIENEIPNLEIISFSSQLLKEVAKSKVIVTRAGASTLAELITLNKKIVAIPSPNVVADHQTKNAEQFTDLKNFVLLPEDEATTDELIKIIKKLENENHEMIINQKYYEIEKYLSEVIDKWQDIKK